MSFPSGYKVSNQTLLSASEGESSNSYNTMSEVAKFKRRNIFLVNPVSTALRERSSIPTINRRDPQTSQPRSELSPECYVLVINSSQEMAKAITLQLSLSIPGCSIIYAPSVQLASLIIRRRMIDLVVSSPLLPDGPVTNLQAALEELEMPPDLIVVGDSTAQYHDLLKHTRYHYVTQRKVRSEDSNTIDQAVKSLGADIRNDLNNPLQEIVAMVFIARNGKANSNTKQALDAIDKAAHNMASIVNSLEEKIRDKVSGPSES